MAFVTNLLKSYTSGAPLKYGNKLFTAAQVKAILEKLELFVGAGVNPDVKAYSQSTDPTSGQTQGLWWRKNRNPNTGFYPVVERGWTSTGISISSGRVAVEWHWDIVRSEVFHV